MGSCLSKKDPSSSSSSSKVAVSATKPAPEPVKPVSNPNPPEKKVPDEQQSKGRKEVFVIKHRRSHERSNVVASDSTTTTSTESESGGHEMGQNLIASNVNLILNGSAPPRASSCTKEEVDAILIQCGRLSRSSSGARKYSGSKRSYDFDTDGVAGDGIYGDEDEDRLHRQCRASPQGRRRRTPSREREQSGLRSNSRARNGNGGSRRVSRSPGRRSENNSSTTNNGNGNGNSNRPGKMVSVPATVTSLVMDKSNNNGAVAGEPAVKRVTVKRNVSPARANPNGCGENARARSPARANPNGSNENPRARSPARTNPNGSNSENLRARSPARTNPNGSTENLRARSPARANPNGSNSENPRARSPARCNENQQQLLNRSSSRKGEQSPYRRNPLSEIDPNSLAYPQPSKNNNNSRNQIKTRESEADGQKPNLQSKAMNVTLTRTRSSRRSQDLDFNPEALLNPNPNPNPSYTSLLLEDIQNFQQKSTTSHVTPPSFQLPACVTKANSIVEAVADLNSTTSSNLTDQVSGNRRQKQNDDLMEPSFHKYVTVTRGDRGGEMVEEEESSGSNSFVGQRGISISSSFEPNSADSTDRWASSRSDEQGMEIEEARRGFSGKRRDFYHQQGIGRGRAGGNRGAQSLTVAAST